jgi:Ca2+-binding RTX toxin-like protein
MPLAQPSSDSILGTTESASHAFICACYGCCAERLDALAALEEARGGRIIRRQLIRDVEWYQPFAPQPSVDLSPINSEGDSLVKERQTAPSSQTTEALAASPISPSPSRATAAAAVTGIRFVDVTRAAGLSTKPTQTWGSAWGDIDGDGDLDLWVNRHQLSPPSMYRNLGNGKFQNVTDQVFLSNQINGDFHGAAFIDVDNDGDQDLIQLAGGDQGADDANPNKEKKLFINNNGVFRDQAKAKGVDYITGRGRVPVPLDVNNDGLLDFVFTGPPRDNGTAPPTIFRQRANGTFQNIGNFANLSPDVPSGTFGLVSDLTGDRRLELIYATESPRVTIYNTAGLATNKPLRDITASILPNLGSDKDPIQDVSIADFNGDGRQDMLIIRQGSITSGVRRDNPFGGRARIFLTKAMERGIDIATNGRMRFDFDGDNSLNLPQFMLGTRVKPRDIKIGAQGLNPASAEFTLNPTDPGITTRPNYTPGVSRGVFIWYNNTQKQWQVRYSAAGRDEVSFIFRASQEVGQIAGINFEQQPVRLKDTLLINTPQGFVDRTSTSGLNLGTGEVNVVEGDFDNDKDIDLYMVASDLTQNLPNTLYENRGNGTFKKVVGAGGAEGTKLGIGDSVSTADFDADGFLDLFVTNGDVFGFMRPFYLDGANALLRNQGNGNHWLQIDLVGVSGNQDGIGARVEVTSGGVTQVREQNGGIHNKAQNSKRLHFGLGKDRIISRIEVFWPNSTRPQVLTNVRVDQILTISQGRTSAAAATVPGEGEPTNQADSLAGTTGDDLLQGRVGQDSLRGGDGNDQLKGGGNPDKLLGEDGNDILTGSSGPDTLTGGEGADQFRFSNPTQGVDVITDFSPGLDRLVLVANQFGELRQGALAPSAFEVGSQATRRGTRLFFDSSGTPHRLWFDRDGSGSAKAELLAEFTNDVTLTSNDILMQ